MLSVAGAKQYRLSDEARKTMRPVAEDTQLFQVLRFDGPRLHYEARTATGSAEWQTWADREPGEAARMRSEVEQVADDTARRIASATCGAG